MIPLLLAATINTTAVKANPLEKCVFVIQIHQPKSKKQWVLCATEVYNVPGADP